MKGVVPVTTADDGLQLPGQPASVPEARRFVRQRLPVDCPETVADAAELCVSELVTNAVLHAASALTVQVATLGDRLRLAVYDSSSVLPRWSPHSRVATTGRGLELVATLATSWGVEPRPPGKAVWCELLLQAAEVVSEASVEDILAAWDDAMDEVAVDPRAAVGELDGAEHDAGPGARALAARLPVEATAATGPDAGPDAAAPAPTSQPSTPMVSLLGYPVGRAMRAKEHSDSLLRECMLLRAWTGNGEQGMSGAPARVAELAELLAGRYSAALAEPERRKLEAFLAGEATVDLSYPMMAEAPAIITAWQSALAEMDTYCRERALLTLTTPPEILELQDWVLSEFARQYEGHPPTPWPGAVD